MRFDCRLTIPSAQHSVTLAIVSVALVMFACFAMTGCRPNTPTVAKKEGIDPVINPARPTKVANPRVFKSPAELFAEMPKGEYPKRSLPGKLQIETSHQWIDKNRIGHQIEWTATVKDVLTRGSDGRLFVELVADGTWANKGAGPYAWYWEEPVSFGEEKYQILVRATSTYRKAITFGPVDSDTAKKFVDWKGKKAVIQATITGVEFGSSVLGAAGGKEMIPFSCLVTATPTVIDGFAPPQSEKE